MSNKSNIVNNQKRIFRLDMNTIPAIRFERKNKGKMRVSNNAKGMMRDPNKIANWLNKISSKRYGYNFFIKLAYSNNSLLNLYPL